MINLQISNNEQSGCQIAELQQAVAHDICLWHEHSVLRMDNQLILASKVGFRLCCLSTSRGLTLMDQERLKPVVACMGVEDRE